MSCPKCKGADFAINDTRQLGSGLLPQDPEPWAVRRYRRCLACGHRTPTYEILADHYDYLLSLARVVSVGKPTLPALPREDDEPPLPEGQDKKT